MSRRDVLRQGALGGAALTMPGVLGACGGGWPLRLRVVVVIRHSEREDRKMTSKPRRTSRPSATFPERLHDMMEFAESCGDRTIVEWILKWQIVMG